MRPHHPAGGSDSAAPEPPAGDDGRSAERARGAWATAPGSLPAAGESRAAGALASVGLWPVSDDGHVPLRAARPVVDGTAGARVDGDAGPSRDDPLPADAAPPQPGDGAETLPEGGARPQSDGVADALPDDAAPPLLDDAVLPLAGGVAQPVVGGAARPQPGDFAQPLPEGDPRSSQLGEVAEPLSGRAGSLPLDGAVVPSGDGVAGPLVDGGARPLPDDAGPLPLDGVPVPSGDGVAGPLVDAVARPLSDDAGSLLVDGVVVPSDDGVAGPPGDSAGTLLVDGAVVPPGDGVARSLVDGVAELRPDDAGALRVDGVVGPAGDGVAQPLVGGGAQSTPDGVGWVGADGGGRALGDWADAGVVGLPSGGVGAGRAGAGEHLEGVGAATSRTKAIFGFLGVVVVIVVAAVMGLVKPGPVRGWLDGEISVVPTGVAVVPEPVPTPVLVAAGGGVKPSAAGIKAALDPLVGAAALGSRASASVIDVASGEVLYARNAGVPATPASTTKLLTAATVLAARGPAYRLRTRAVAGSAPGEVVLIGGGDPTLSVGAKGLFPRAARLDQLAAQVKKALGGAKPARVLVDTSLFTGPETGKGWAPDDISPLGQVARVQPLMTDAGRIKPVHNEHGGDPRFGDPAIAAGKAFAKMLGAPASSVRRGRAPAAGTPLGEVQSPPLVQLTDWMLQQSDNAMAEVLARQVALAAGKPGSFAGATGAIVERLRQWGLAAGEARLYDGSGLSRSNKISPRLLTQLLGFAASGRDPAVTSIFGGLPVAGWSGTMAKRFAAPKANQAGRGLVRAKTGTLRGVSTMAGQVVTRDGRLLVFAVMASGSGSAYTAKAAVDRVPVRLVACGC